MEAGKREEQVDHTCEYAAKPVSVFRERFNQILQNALLEVCVVSDYAAARTQ